MLVSEAFDTILCTIGPNAMMKSGWMHDFT